MKRNSDHIQKIFNDYRKNVMPPDAGPLQIKECEMAFFAGVCGIMAVIMTGPTPGPDCTPMDESFMLEIEDELKRYVARVIESPSCPHGVHEFRQFPGGIIRCQHCGILH